MRVEDKMDAKQGHWVLAKLGKRVLRPGGLELTRSMIGHLEIGKEDDVVEFAPGLGITAEMTLAKEPKSYTAVEINREAGRLFMDWLGSKEVKQVIADAAATGLPGGYADKVYGEAMQRCYRLNVKRLL